eukprot:11642887-Alexandrium_andersonii.AAC.1
MSSFKQPCEAPPARPPARLVVRFGICANKSAEPTTRELRGAILVPFLGPRSSKLERLELVCMF